MGIRSHALGCDGEPEAHVNSMKRVNRRAKLVMVLGIEFPVCPDFVIPLLPDSRLRSERPSLVPPLAHRIEHDEASIPVILWGLASRHLLVQRNGVVIEQWNCAALLH